MLQRGPDCILAGKKLRRHMLLKAFAPSDERMMQNSSKPSVVVSAKISTPPETVALYWPQCWK